MTTSIEALAIAGGAATQKINASSEPICWNATESIPLEVSMIDHRTAPYAALVLRVSLGVLFLAHAGLKLFVFTPAGTAHFFGSLGLPPALAYLTIAAETAGGAALVVGFFSRLVAPALIPILLGAIFTVHGAAGFFFNNPNGGWEFLALWIAGLVALALLGDGAYALRPVWLRAVRAAAP